jgi:cytochrome c-type biogenesis protein CcmH/NrfG
LQNPHDKIERSVIKIVAWTVGIIILLVAGGIFGARSYRAWQERRLVARGNALVNEGDIKRASLDARRIIQINPDSAEGCRMMARIAEVSALPAAVDWRRRAADISGSSADLIALARASLRFNNPGNRDYALSRIPESAKNSAEYHALASELANSRRDSKTMEQELREAVRLDPANKDYQLRLATLQLNSNDRATADQGRETLVRLQAEQSMRRDATRRLVNDSLRRLDYDRALQDAKKLQEFPEHEFSDRLLLLSALHGAIDPGFTPLLQTIEKDAAANPDQVAEVLSWLNSHQMPAAAIVWAAQLPPETLTQRSTALALSDAYVAARDWTGLQKLVKSSNWGPLEFLRCALAARVSRELGDESEGAAQWAEALSKVSAEPQQALTLAEIVLKWGWRDQAVELYWAAAKDPTKGDEALQVLYGYFAQTGSTQDLYRVLVHRREFRPNDLDIQNNLAQLSLLLNLNTAEGHRLARDLFEKQPTNPAYVSTYGFALYTQGDIKKALSVFGRLNEQQLRDPAIAAYYGLILAASGDHARASEFLAIGENAQLLPEEKALVEKARRTLAKS